MQEHLFFYRVTQIIRVHDGDSCRLVLDMGFKTYAEKATRLARINAPEMRDPDPEVKTKAYAARDYLRERLGAAMAAGGDVIIHSVKLEKYGRALIELFVDGVNINDELVQEGHAVTYD